jgi:hypothetical protein
LRQVSEDEQQVRQPKPSDNSKRQDIVNDLVAKNAKLKKLKMEIKDVEDGAWEACGDTPKVIRQLAKIAAWDATKRARYDQELDAIWQGRKALGLLAGTPLGQAALGEEIVDDADETQHHVTNPKYKAPSRAKAKDKKSGKKTAKTTADATA